LFAECHADCDIGLPHDCVGKIRLADTVDSIILL